MRRSLGPRCPTPTPTTPSTVITLDSSRPVSAARRLLRRRHGGVLLFGGVFVILSTLIRVVLLAKAARDVSWDSSLLVAAAWGLLFDVATAAWMALPWIVLLTILPAGVFRKTWARVAVLAVVFSVLFVLVFGGVAEWVFWDEFGARFNFIAVDYLVYTTELLGTIRESYPVPLILGGVLAATSLVFWLAWRTGLPAAWLHAEHEPARARFVAGAVFAVLSLASGLLVRSEWLPAFGNNFNRELARNGLWSLVAAFKNNELDYERFYPTMPIDEAFGQLREQLVEDGSVLLRPDALDSLRLISNPGPEIRPNVIQITVESLSARFVGAWNPESTLTPHLDALAKDSLVFTRAYATGTRTDRGMEALTLSLPPTPGRSIVKRPHGEGLFTLGSVFESKGYETAFIYGGFGYFDNMNHFFGNNGYRVVDRSSVGSEEVTFANVWGACDEDLYRWTIREADAAHSKGNPFHFFVMTTSNHRPYTFPDGRIDMPSKVSGRRGAVKYTDFAIGELIREASTRPWFRDTIFVFVADHCASSAGRTELPVENYHVPLMVHAPGGQVAPGHVDTMMSQMDYAPTLLGLLGWTYPSRFFGHDVRRVEPSDAHALIGTYQKLGHVEHGEMIVLGPQRSESHYSVDREDHVTPSDAPSDEARREAIGFYQAAGHVVRNGTYAALSPAEMARWMLAAPRTRAGGRRDSPVP